MDFVKQETEAEAPSQAMKQFQALFNTQQPSINGVNGYNEILVTKGPFVAMRLQRRNG